MTVVLKATAYGSFDIGFDNFAVTNKDATLRQTDLSFESTITVSGTDGEIEISKDALMNLIHLSESELNAVLINNDYTVVSKNNYCVNQSSYDRLKNAVEVAKSSYEDEFLGTDDLKNAIENLNNELSIFKANKEQGIYLRKVRHVTNNINVTVTATVGEHGSIDEKFKTQTAKSGTSVTVIVKPDEGYVVDKVFVNGKETNGESTFTLQNVTNDTSLKFTFREKDIFVDVPYGEWFYNDVNTVYKKGLMLGVGNEMFAPQTKVTRAMFVTVLYRIEGTPESSVSKFTDVEKDSYYEKAVSWANENKIVSGISNKEFAPNNNITREQIATIVK